MGPAGRSRLWSDARRKSLALNEAGPPKSLANVIPGRIGQILTVRVFDPHTGGLAWLTGLHGQPLGPFWPPRSFDVWRRLQPLVRADVHSIRCRCLDLIAMARLARRRDDAGIVAAAGQNVCNIGIHLIMYFVGGLP